MLKGGSLLYAIDRLDARPTVDVDFLGDKISRDRNHLHSVFQEILAIECVEDGVWFDIENLRAEPITVEKDYPGTRFFITAHLDTIVHNLSIDIGFGDIITPAAATIDFPLLIPNNPGASIKAYSLETVLAEKFHTMVDRDVLNSRMKDFFDCYQILTTKAIDEVILKEAVFATFKNRHLAYNKDLQLFTDAFINDEVRTKRWQSFLRKIKWQLIPFADVMNVIKTHFAPILEEYRQIH